jgi:hypothetical protein
MTETIHSIAGLAIGAIAFMTVAWIATCLVDIAFACFRSFARIVFDAPPQSQSDVNAINWLSIFIGVAITLIWFAFS